VKKISLSSSNKIDSSIIINTNTISNKILLIQPINSSRWIWFSRISSISNSRIEIIIIAQVAIEINNSISLVEGVVRVQPNQIIIFNSSKWIQTNGHKTRNSNLMLSAIIMAMEINLQIVSRHTYIGLSLKCKTNNNICSSNNSKWDKWLNSSNSSRSVCNSKYSNRIRYSHSNNR